MSWSATQKYVALLSEESEGKAAVQCAQDMIYAKKLLESLGLEFELLMVMHVDNKGTIAMPLVLSFKEYYSHQDVCAGGNGNVKAFNMTMDIETNKVDALKAFNNANRIIISVGLLNKIKLIHGMKDFGNTIGRPNSKICGHIGINNNTFVGVIDHAKALSFTQ